jgi:HEAT repeat protein
MKESTVRGLIQLLGHEDFLVQQNAMKALVSFGEKAIIALLSSIDSPDPTVRLGVVEVLGTLKDPCAIPHLAGKLLDRNSEVRWQAAIALG